MAAGRPSKYTKVLADEICRWLESGKTLRAFCEQTDKPTRTSVMRWLAKSEEFRYQYAQAREKQADQIFEECLQIADDGMNDTYVDDKGNTRTDHDVVHRSRLRIDTRKWFLSKLHPKKYGDKQEAETEDRKPLTIILERGPTPERLKLVTEEDKKPGNGTDG